ncbi:MAG: type VI secretion system baseplate subunit TssG [Candidatus Eisenbacteria bacterium]
MADTDRTTSAALEWLEALEAEPYRHGFYSALRKLEAMHPDRPRLGRSTRPADDPIRLGQDPTLAFAPASLSRVERNAHGIPPKLLVYFFGLFGPNGPLPTHLTEYARQRMRSESDPTLARFADIFHHRMLSLFYRAWADGEPVVNADRPGEDRFAQYAGALCGYGQKSLLGRDTVTDSAKRFFAGRFALQTKNAEGLESILRGFFEIPTQIEEFVGEWLYLPDDSVWRLGDAGPPGPGGRLGQLGQSTTIGARVWQCQQKFRVILGPMPYRVYERFLPGSEGLQRLVDLVRNYVGDELLWDVNLILEKDEVPPLRLGESGRLGWSSWIASRPLEKDDDCARFTPVAQTT